MKPGPNTLGLRLEEPFALRWDNLKVSISFRIYLLLILDGFVFTKKSLHASSERLAVDDLLHGILRKFSTNLLDIIHKL